MGLTLKRAAVEGAIKKLENEKAEWEKSREAKVKAYLASVKVEAVKRLDAFASAASDLIESTQKRLKKVRAIGAKLTTNPTPEIVAEFNEVASLSNAYYHNSFGVSSGDGLFGVRSVSVGHGRSWSRHDADMSKWPGEAQLARVRGLLALFDGPTVTLSSRTAEKLLGSDDGLLSLLG